MCPEKAPRRAHAQEFLVGRGVPSQDPFLSAHATNAPVNDLTHVVFMPTLLKAATHSSNPFPRRT